MKINNTMKVFNFRKVDYLIKHNLKPVGAGYKNNEPYIFVECKPLDTDLSKYIGQLERYFSATIGVRYGILTDGNKWLFFTDNDNVNLMDKKPFYTLYNHHIHKRCFLSQIGFLQVLPFLTL